MHIHEPVIDSAQAKVINNNNEGRGACGKYPFAISVKPNVLGKSLRGIGVKEILSMNLIVAVKSKPRKCIFINF